MEDVKKKYPWISTDDNMLEQYKVNCLKFSNFVNLLILDIDLWTLIIHLSVCLLLHKETTVFPIVIHLN